MPSRGETPEQRRGSTSSWSPTALLIARRHLASQCRDEGESEAVPLTPRPPTCTVTCNFSVWRESFFPCQQVLSICERKCKTAPGEERLFHPVLKPSQRDKFCSFYFLCEFFSFFFFHTALFIAWNNGASVGQRRIVLFMCPVPCTVPTLVSLGCPAPLAAGKKVGSMLLDGAGRSENECWQPDSQINLSSARRLLLT